MGGGEVGALGSLQRVGEGGTELWFCCRWRGSGDAMGGCVCCLKWELFQAGR